MQSKTLETLLIDVSDANVVTVTMNRPDQLNILGEPGDGDAFRKVFDAINEDRTIKCVIFTGAGRAFSAGGNVKDMRDRENLFAGSQADIADNYRNNVHEIVRSIWHCAVPVIAAVNGPAVGLGHDVSGLCDIRLAAQSARFGSTLPSTNDIKSKINKSVSIKPVGLIIILLIFSLCFHGLITSFLGQ